MISQKGRHSRRCNPVTSSAEDVHLDYIYISWTISATFLAFQLSTGVMIPLAMYVRESSSRWCWPMKVCEQRHGILSQWEDFESSLAKIVDFPAFTNEITMIYHDVITDRCVYDFYITKSLFSITCHGTSCFSAVLTETEICVSYVYPRRPKITETILAQKTWIRSNDEKRMRLKRVVDTFFGGYVYTLED